MNYNNLYRPGLSAMIQLPAQADRQVHVRGAGARLSQRCRRGRADRAEPRRAEWWPPLLEHDGRRRVRDGMVRLASAKRSRGGTTRRTGAQAIRTCQTLATIIAGQPTVRFRMSGGNDHCLGRMSRGLAAMTEKCLFFAPLLCPNTFDALWFISRKTRSGGAWLRPAGFPTTRAAPSTFRPTDPGGFAWTRPMRLFRPPLNSSLRGSS
jgi:hypothetical protein